MLFELKASAAFYHPIRLKMSGDCVEGRVRKGRQLATKGGKIIPAPKWEMGQAVNFVAGLGRKKQEGE